MSFKKLQFQKITFEEMDYNANQFFQKVSSRRSVRDFSRDDFPIDIIKNCIKSASTAPSGANKQPWHFVIVKDPIIKRKIRKAAEIEEKEFYGGRAPKEWLDDLNQFGTDWNKPFLEEAPYLIVVFSKKFDINDDGTNTKNYYVSESVGIASGLLLTALHNAGLVTLTHTPSPMAFLSDILNRPPSDKPYLIIPVGFPSENAEVPNIKKKTFKEICTIL
ncbi:oxidoreductase [bacterium]|jgi:iodotyrosine deiodinase|nr:MAG: oxidoreductase [bacterium]|tara:strand:+ start:300 stop:956 length:657 start_codon:yes stop_codon:yes gene_type:complete